jgi:very-short-patch-repair endonuclease
MEKIVEILCEYCGKAVMRPRKEVTRSLKIGRRFFCNNSCGAKYSNASRKAEEFTKVCPVCEEEFTTSNKAHANKIYCSLYCLNHDPNRTTALYTEASLKAMRDSGKKQQGNLDVAKAMKTREAWKYVELEKTLKTIPHEFEFKVDKYIFDLALPEHLLLVEFDGREHRTAKQKAVDAIKEELAKDLGYVVYHINVKSASVIPSNVLYGLVPVP